MNARMTRALEQATGLDGLLITPGPDLVYFTGHRPPITERLTLLVLRPGHQPHLIVPTLELPHDPGELTLIAWEDGDDPYALVADLLDPRGRYAVSDSAWALHLLALQEVAPHTRYTS